MEAEVILSKERLKAVHALFRLQWQDISACRGPEAAKKFTETAHFRQNFVDCSPWLDECKFLADLSDGQPDAALRLFDATQSKKPHGSLKHLIYSSTMPHHCPLHIAASKGYTTIIDRLLNSGSDLNLPDMMGHTALCLSAEHQQVAALRQLLSAGADINRCGLAGWTPLIIAARLGHLDILEELTASPKLNLHQMDCCGRNAASHAISAGHSEVLRHLLERGIETNVIDYRGRSLADELKASRAASAKRSAMQAMLAHADLRRTALLAQGENPRGHNLLSGPVDDATLLSIMTSPETSPALLHTASALKFATSGYTPPAPGSAEGQMLAAMERKDHHTVRVIAANELESNPRFNLDARNAEGLTILFMAVQQRRSAIIHFSLNRGANPNIGNALDVTPLMHAIETKQDGLAEIFLTSSRTDPTLTDYAGRTARDYALEQKTTKLISKLSDAEMAWRIKHEATLIAPA